MLPNLLNAFERPMKVIQQVQQYPRGKFCQGGFKITFLINLVALRAVAEQRMVGESKG